MKKFAFLLLVVLALVLIAPAEPVAAYDFQCHQECFDEHTNCRENCWGFGQWCYDLCYDNLEFCRNSCP